MCEGKRSRMADGKKEKKTDCKTNRKKGSWKQPLRKSIKIALAALAAIALAGELGLTYSATAGIITILSIQNTKRETIRSARNRGMAFVCALLLAAVCFGGLGYTLPAFAAYLFLFALVCLRLSWGEAIAMDSVLVSHFLLEGNMAPELLLNEILLFLIGTGFGIAVNLHLHRKSQEFERLSEEVDIQMKGILQRMSRWLPEEDKTNYSAHCFGALDQALEAAKLCAAANYNNALLQKDTGELDYIHMREQQRMVLEGIYVNIKALEYLPEQARSVAQLIAQIEQEYHRNNTVESLLEKLEELFQEMKEQPLPKSREEFEARAILFYILMQLKSLLKLKYDYYKGAAE